MGVGLELNVRVAVAELDPESDLGAEEEALTEGDSDRGPLRPYRPPSGLLCVAVGLTCVDVVGVKPVLAVM